MRFVSLTKYQYSRTYIYDGKSWSREIVAFSRARRLQPCHSEPFEDAWARLDVHLLEIARIKASIADGSYRVSASTLAAKMIAAGDKNSRRQPKLAID
jgi:hypothetical protein